MDEFELFLMQFVYDRSTQAVKFRLPYEALKKDHYRLYAGADKSHVRR